MNNAIRKISVGKDYPDGTIHYQVGSVQNLKGNKYRITNIVIDRDLLDLHRLAYNIYITNIPKASDEAVGEVLWKTVLGVPVIVEYKIDFE